MPQPVVTIVAKASETTISTRASKLGCMAKTSSDNAANYNDSSSGDSPREPVAGGAEIRATIPPDCAGLRLDHALARLFPDYSRSRLQAWVKSGSLKVAGVS